MSHHAHFADQQHTPPVEKDGEVIDFENGNKKNEPIPFSRCVFWLDWAYAKFTADTRPATPVPAHVSNTGVVLDMIDLTIRTNLHLSVWAPWERGWR